MIKQYIIKLYIRIPRIKEDTFISEIAAPNDVTTDKLYDT